LTTSPVLTTSSSMMSQPSPPRVSTPTEPAKGLESYCPLQPGMERGFALSDMASLLMQYNQQNDDELSLFMRTTSIASKKALGISDIIDRGVNIIKQPIARFGLETGFLLRTVDLSWQQTTTCYRLTSRKSLRDLDIGHGVVLASSIPITNVHYE
jgi:hypothetical protein